MKTLNKFVTLVIASFLFAGCAAEVLPNGSALLEDHGDDTGDFVLVEDDSEEITPSPLWLDGHQAVGADSVEQWLRVENLQTRAPVQTLCLCEANYHASESPNCTETDSDGQLLTHWTPVNETYRMIGTTDDGIKFVLQDVADTETMNRLERPIRVLNGEQLKAYYGRAMTSLNPDHHTVVARARVGNVVADAVRFELHPVDTYETRVRLASYPDADGELAGELETSSSLGQGVFLDVVPGIYELRAERNGKPCSSAEIWLDGLVDQFIAPELACE